MRNNYYLDDGYFYALNVGIRQYLLLLPKLKKSHMVIDVSSHNGTVDFTNMPDVTDVFIRATIGYGTVDTMMTKHAEAASAAGKRISFYHFPYMHDGVDVVADATKQAHFFLDTIAQLPVYTHLAADCEEYDAKGLPTSDTHVSKTDFELWLKTFYDTLADCGVACNTMALYSYRDYLDRHLPDNHALGCYLLWLASYTPGITAPKLPVGWDAYWLWQYSEHGAPGVPRTDLDVSRFNSQK